MGFLIVLIWLDRFAIFSGTHLNTVGFLDGEHLAVLLGSCNGHHFVLCVLGVFVVVVLTKIYAKCCQKHLEYYLLGYLLGCAFLV